MRRDVALWFGDAEGFTVTRGSSIEENAFAGVVVADSRDVTPSSRRAPKGSRAREGIIGPMS